MRYLNKFYIEYKKNFYSQNGEDGIILELISRMNIKTGWTCEFGAGNGIRFSNTKCLIDKGFKGVFIENDEKEYEELEKNFHDHPNMLILKETINYTDNLLDDILVKHKIPFDLILLSIDVDSYDYQIWKSIKKYKPLIVIIEINSSADPTLENHIYDGEKYKGTSFMPMYKLGLSKGYTFLCHTGNMIFIRNDIYENLKIPKPDTPLANFKRDWLNKEVWKKIENI